MVTSCTYRHVMLARAENMKGNVHVVSKMYMYNRTIFMQKYIELFDGRSIKHIQVHCLSPRFLNFATSTCTCIWNTYTLWVSQKQFNYCLQSIHSCRLFPLYEKKLFLLYSSVHLLLAKSILYHMFSIFHTRNTTNLTKISLA